MSVGTESAENSPAKAGVNSSTSPDNNESAKGRVTPLRRSVRSYLFAIVAAGFSTILLSLFQVVVEPPPSTWLLLAFGGALASLFPVKIARVRSMISISDSIVYANMIMFGPAAAALTAAVEGFTASLRFKKKSRLLAYMLFNSAAMALSAYAAGWMFFLVLGRGPLHVGPAATPLQILLPAALLVAVHFLCNSMSVAIMLSLEGGAGIFRTWRDNFLWASLTYFTAGSIAVLLAINANSLNPATIGFLSPVLFVVYFTYRTYLNSETEKQHAQEMSRLYSSTVEALARAIDARDHSTYGHARRVQVYALGLARAAGITDHNILRGLDAAALLHDMGNLAVPEYILNKAGTLTESEFEEVKSHPEVGADILRTIRFPYPVVEYVLHHHEHWNGTGYPKGLQGEEIPIGARILGIADCYEALTCERPHQARMSDETALETLQALAGRHYDPILVDAFARVVLDLAAEVKTIDDDLRHRHHPREDQVSDQPDANLDSESSEQSVAFRRIFNTQKEEAILKELAQNLGSTLRLHEVLEIIGGYVGQSVPFTTCAIYLETEDGARLTAAHVRGRNQEAFKFHSVEFGAGIIGRAAALEQIAHDVLRAEQLPDIWEKLEIPLRRFLVIPLRFEERCLGALALFRADRAQIQNDHLRFLGILAEKGATAIHHASSFEESLQDAYTDSLTKLPNSRYLRKQFEREIENARRYRHPLSFLVMDLDGFKAVNDRYGHQTGDRMLLEVGKVMKSALRSADSLIRYGGDEFVVVMPETRFARAADVALRLQTVVADFALEIGPGERAKVGVSIGIASYPEDGDSLETLMAAADGEMYRNKSHRKKASSHIDDPLEPETLRS